MSHKPAQKSARIGDEPRPNMSLGPSSSSPRDRTTILVGSLRGKNADAGRLLQEIYRDALVRFCWGYLHSLEEAEDAFQDICVKVLEMPEIPDHFRGWLYKVARNHCLNLLRRRAGHEDGRPLPSASKMYAALTGNLTRLVRDEVQAGVAELFERLDETYREVLRLRYVEDLSRGEIAEVLEIPESVVKSRLFEGLKTLREGAARLGGA